MEVTVRELADIFKRMPEVVENEFRKTTTQLARNILAFDRKTITDQIYSLPEDVTSTGKKKWRRTGALRRGERVETPDAYTIHVANDVSYTEPRHEANKPGRRQINPLRTSHWRDDLMTTFEPIVTEAYNLTVVAILKAAK